VTVRAEQARAEQGEEDKDMAATLLGPERPHDLRDSLRQVASDGGALQPPLRLRPLW